MIKKSELRSFLKLFLIALAAAPVAEAQKKISIDSVYYWAESNYPLIKRADLLRQAEDFSLSNIQKGNFPQLSLNGQASYQSDVTQLPHVPNQPIIVDVLSKDQYKVTIDLAQNIYDGGSISSQKQIQKASTQVELANMRKDLFQIRERINQIYFGVLLLTVQLEQNDTLISQLRETKKRTEAAIQNGSAFKSDADQLQAEILVQQQKQFDLEAARTSYLQMLSAFTGKNVSDESQLIIPAELNNWLNTENTRPELKAFEQQNILYDQQERLLKSRTIPKISLFGQGGYGRPGLNMLKNEFSPYYIAGLRLNWNFSSFYTLKNDKAILQLQKQTVDVNKETFLFNNNLSLLQQDNEKIRYDKLIKSDDEIVQLKEKITQTARAKYENGVITLNDYLKEINTLNISKLLREIHRIQSLSNQYNRLYTLGHTKP